VNAWRVPIVGVSTAKATNHLLPRRLLLLVVLTALALASPGAILAHEGATAGRETVIAGPYMLDVLFYNEARAGRELQLVVVPVGGSARPRPGAITIVAQPGAGISATVQRARVVPDPDRPGAYAVAVLLPVTGAWILRLEAVGPAGEGVGRLPVAAASPGAVPVPVGWALGLAPLAGLLAFAVAQRRWLARQTGAQAEPSAAVEGATGDGRA